LNLVICFSLRFGLIPICEVELGFEEPLIVEVDVGRGEAALNANNGCCDLFLLVLLDSRFLCDLFVVGIVVLLLLLVLFVEDCCVDDCDLGVLLVVIDVLLISLIDVGLLGELTMSLLLTLVVDTGAAASDELLPSGRSAKLLPETARFLIGFIFYIVVWYYYYGRLLATRRPMLGAPIKSCCV